MGFLNNVKLVFAALVAGVVAILYFLFKNEQGKNEKLEKENKIIKDNIDVIEEKHKDDEVIHEFKEIRVENESAISEKAHEEILSDIDKIHNTSDGEKYEVKL